LNRSRNTFLSNFPSDVFGTSAMKSVAFSLPVFPHARRLRRAIGHPSI